MLIIKSFRDLSVSTSSIANKFNVSDTYVLDTLNRYVKMAYLPLADIISIDDVFLELDEHCKCTLVIQDFYTGNPIDLLSSRKTNLEEPYFINMPLSERANIKYLISNMYNLHFQWIGKHSPNAVPVVDSAHVIQ